MANKEELIQKLDLTKVPEIEELKSNDTILCVSDNKVSQTKQNNINNITVLDDRLNNGWYKVGKIPKYSYFILEFEVRRNWNLLPTSTGKFYIFGGYPKLIGMKITHTYRLEIDKYCIKDEELYLYHPSANNMTITSRNSDLILFPKAEKVDSVPEDLIQEFKTIKYE